MSLQSSRRRSVRFPFRAPAQRIKRAAAHVVEALESRRLLDATQQFIYTWDHMGPVVRHDLAVLETIYPDATARLDAYVESLGLAPIDPMAGTLWDAGAAAAKGKLGIRHHKPPPHHHSPKPHHKPHGKGSGSAPSVASVAFTDDAEPNTVTINFDQGVSVNGADAISFLNLTTPSQPPAVTLVSSSSTSLLYNVGGNTPGVPPLTDGNYAVVLKGSEISNSNGNLTGSDGVPGDLYVSPFSFNHADINNDGAINTLDLQKILFNFNVNQPVPKFSDGDTNYDGVVNTLDLQAVLAQFNTVVAPLNAPVTPYVTSVGNNSIQIAWNSSDVDAKSYDIYRDSTFIANVSNATSFTDNVTPGTHNYFVVARLSASGNTSYPSGELIATTAPQATPPTLITNELPQQLQFTFNQHLTAVNWTNAVSIINLNTNQPVVPSASSFTQAGTGTYFLTYSFNSNLPLVDGNYAAILHSAQIVSDQGVELAGSDGVAGDDYLSNFYFLQGDIAGGTVSQTNPTGGDLVLDSNDLNKIQNAITTPPAQISYLNGDVNFSGTIDATDLSAEQQFPIRSLTQLATPSLPTTTTDSASVTLSWTALGNTTYDVYRNFQFIGTTALGSFPDNNNGQGLAQNTTYTYFIVARDAAGDSSYNTLEVTTKTSLPTPAAPGNFTVAPNGTTPTSLLLTWSDTSAPPLTYNLFRDNVLIATNLTATAYLDSGLAPGTSHNYAVAALNSLGVASSSQATLLATTSAATSTYAVTPPQPATNVTASGGTSAVRINWTASPSASPSNLITYEIDRNGVAIGGTTLTSFTDSTATAGIFYTYSVIAYDASYNASPPASAGSFTVSDTTAPNSPIDLQVTQNDGTAVSLSWVQPWDDVAVTGYIVTRSPGGPQNASGTTFTDHTVAAGTSYTYSVQAVDGSAHTGNPTSISVTTPGGAPPNADSSPNQYIPPDWLDYLYRPTDGLEAVFRSKMMSVGQSPPLAANWFDPMNSQNQGDSLLTPATLPYTAVTLIHGTQGGYAYWDIGGSGIWQPVDPVWKISPGNGNSYAGGPLTYNPNGYSVPVGTWGKTNGVCSAPGNGGDVVWVDHTTFGQDLVSIYNSLPQLLQRFAQDYSPTTYTLASLLTQVLGETNWTKVPGIADAATGLNLKYIQGVPTATGVFFAQQLSELQQAINALVYYPFRYDTWILDPNIANSFAQEAKKVLSVYESVYGDVKTQATPLAKTIATHQADIGVAFQSSLVNDLWAAVEDIAGVIYVRANGAWATYNGEPYTFDSTVGRPSLLAFNNGVWPGVAASAPINVSDWTNADIVLNKIIPNGLWIKANGAPVYHLNILPGGRYYGSLQHQLQNSNNTDLLSWDPLVFNPPSIGQLWTQTAFENEPPEPDGINRPGLMAWSATPISETVDVPPATNPQGGLDMQNPVTPGPDPQDVGADTWTWGALGHTMFAHSWSDIEQVLQSGYDVAVRLEANGPGTYQVPLSSVPTHLAWDPGDLVGNYNANGQFTWDFNAAVGIEMQLPNTLYGQVPNNGSFSYSPGGSYPTTPTVGNVPTDCVLTTSMDYENVLPDSNLDGIVQVPADLESFGNDTGVIAFQADRDVAQSYLPIFTNTTGPLLIHSYLEQGAFADAANDAALLSDDLSSYPEANQNGLPYASSLDTRVRINLLLDDPNNQVKRIEVVRPGGNVVVFNFPWNSQTSSFSPIGTPAGWNVNGAPRDINRTYVLRDMSTGDFTEADEASGKLHPYALEFASGILQNFSPLSGTLFSVSNSSGLTAFIAPSARYNVTYNWHKNGVGNGLIDSVDYQTITTTLANQPSPHTIETAVGYTANTITSLDKTGITTNTPIPQFSYVLGGDTIVHNASTITRTGTVAGGTVTISLSSADSTIKGSSSETFLFNATGMITSDAVTLDEGNGNPGQTATTAYTYAAGSRSSLNGYAPWGKVTRIVYPDNSWVVYKYDPGTGWLTEQKTPFQSNSSFRSEAFNVAQDFMYGTAASGYGADADPMNLVEQPREVQTQVQGTITSDVFNRYGTAGSSSETTVVTSRAISPDENDTWDASVFQTQTTINGYASSTVSGPSGVFSTTNNGSQLASSQKWSGSTLAQSLTSLNAFGSPTSGNGAALASPYVANSTTSFDAFGRPLADTVTGGIGQSFTYADKTTSTPTWFGPGVVIETDGSETDYTYNNMGEVATKTIYAGTSHSVEYLYAYDLAGNVISKTTQTATSQTGLPVVTNTYQYDAMGRLRQEIDNAGGSSTDPTANRTTTYAWTSGTTGPITNILTITHPDGGTEIDTLYLDGSRASTAGTAAIPATYNEGVVTAGTDANGRADSNVMDGAWTSVTTNGSSNTTITYTNALGEQYLSQETTPSTSNPTAPKTVDATVLFDGNGRPIKTIGYDGTTTLTIYDPITGQAGAQWVDMNHTGVYVGGKDPKTVQQFVEQVTQNGTLAIVPISSPVMNSTTPQGSQILQLSGSGTQISDSLSSNGGLASESIDNGLTTTTVDAPGTADNWIETTTNPDGTRTKDTFTDGQLADEQTLPVTGSVPTTDQTLAYNGLQQSTGGSDYTGTTGSGNFSDGTPQSLTLPGHAQASVAALNPATNDTTQFSRADGGQVYTPENLLGQTQSISGAGVLSANLGYENTTGSQTGNLNSLTTFLGTTTLSGGTLFGTNAATTKWAYDANTGLLTNKTFADGSQNIYQYNSASQLINYVAPGINNSSFAYAGDGSLSAYSLNGGQKDTVSSKVTPAELDTPTVIADGDNGKFSTETNTLNANGQPFLSTFDTAGGDGVAYSYYPTTGYGTSGSPQALSSISVVDRSAIPFASASFAYDSQTKRLFTITVNGVVITYNYVPNSDQLNTVGVTVPGNSQAKGANIIYSTDLTDQARLSQISANTGLFGQAFVETFVANGGHPANGYNQIDQLTGQDITRTDPSGNLTRDTFVYGYDSSKGDALISATDAPSSGPATTYTYGYDGVGNITSMGLNGTTSANPLGTPNLLNQYIGGNYSHNSRGDVIATAGYYIAWDAMDRPITFTPKNPVVGSLQVQLGYDGQDRWLWKDVYSWNGSEWVYSYSRHAIYDGENLVAELDANNLLVKTYTRGLNGLAAITDYNATGGPRTYIPVADYSGNIVELLDPISGAVAADYRYDPYGNLLSATGAAAGVNPFQGKGLYVPAELPGFLFAGHRVTDGKIWLSRDPSGESSDVNLYRLDGGDPINLSDQSGMDAFDVLDLVSPYVVPKVLLKVGIAAGKSGAGFLEAHGWTTAAKIQRFGVGAEKELYSTFNGLDFTNPYQIPSHIRSLLAARDNSAALAQQYAATGQPYPRFAAGFATTVSSIPFVSTFTRGYEMVYDTHITSAGLLGQPLTPEEYGAGGFAIVRDVGTFAAGAIEASAAAPRPILIPDGTGSVVLGTAAPDAILVVRRPPLRSGVLRLPFARSEVEAGIQDSRLSVKTPGQIGLPNNMWGAAGDIAHQATIARLVDMAKQEFPGMQIFQGTSIKPLTGVPRSPDVWAYNPATQQVLKVYEAARYENGVLVPWELSKQAQYKAAGIKYHFEEVR
jgi:hypothetical protein